MLQKLSFILCKKIYNFSWWYHEKLCKVHQLVFVHVITTSIELFSYIAPLETFFAAFYFHKKCCITSGLTFFSLQTSEGINWIVILVEPISSHQNFFYLLIWSTYHVTFSLNPRIFHYRFQIVEEMWMKIYWKLHF